MSLRVLGVVSLGFATAAAVFGQQPTVGSPAPAVVATAWLNWQGDAPTLAQQKGRVVLLEFWGTWCGPCVRAMPGIQKLHDRYHDRGLTVLAISYETPDVLQPFLAKNAWSMPVGSDPDKKTVAAYGIRSWPTTIVIDKDGNVAHVGSPYDAETAVEKALGLEAGAAALLDLYLDSLAQPAKDAQRDALQRLLEKAPPDFDLQAWAKSHLAAETVGEGASPAAPTTGKPAGKTADGKDLLRRCAQAWPGNTAQRDQVLKQLGDGGPSEFDLAGYAQEAFAKAFPFDAAELKSLLQGKKYGAVVEALCQRAPAAAVLATAAKNQDLAGFCKSKAGDARTMAKKGLMARLWVFPGALPRDEQVNSKFFGELSISGMAMSEDKKSIVGLLLGGEMVKKGQVDAFVKSQLTAALVMEDLGAGKPPRTRELMQLFDKERSAIVRDLESRYGKPEPRETK
ncbi:MAG TPA: TlpA disulfide reductase family protein [Planctomycetota bacterium]|nr:TlpA disulfide reductase family protein [Planctomycetota bacterium]